MEIEGEDGSTLFLKTGAKAVFGRGSGCGTEDLTVSRRHVAFDLQPPAEGTDQSSRVSFEVLGRNPIWIRTQANGKVRTFRRSETGEVAAGDRFCVSSQHPVWFTLKRCDEFAEESVSDSEIGLGSVDVSAIDPVKEFGFLVIGREFDGYPKNWVRDIKQWEWFLEEPRKGNGDSDDDDEEEKKGRRRSGRKRRRKKGNEDENWSEESAEDEEMMLMKTRGIQKPTYVTRSKDLTKDAKKRGSSSVQRKQGVVKVEEEQEDEDDETLGGFIVSDEEAELEEEEPSEEEEFEEDDEDEEE